VANQKRLCHCLLFEDAPTTFFTNVIPQQNVPIVPPISEQVQIVPPINKRIGMLARKERFGHKQGIAMLARKERFRHKHGIAMLA
jgi:hypothetical protein